jgi:hypothetical protein
MYDLRYPLNVGQVRFAGPSREFRLRNFGERRPGYVVIARDFFAKTPRLVLMSEVFDGEAETDKPGNCH